MSDEYCRLNPPSWVRALALTALADCPDARKGPTAWSLRRHGRPRAHAAGIGLPAWVAASHEHLGHGASSSEWLSVAAGDDPGQACPSRHPPQVFLGGGAGARFCREWTTIRRSTTRRLGLAGARSSSRARAGGSTLAAGPTQHAVIPRVDPASLRGAMDAAFASELARWAMPRLIRTARRRRSRADDLRQSVPPDPVSPSTPAVRARRGDGDIAAAPIKSWLRVSCVS